MGYFIAVFGEKYAKDSPVDGGKYPLSDADCPKDISVGDTLLLYCTATYPGYYKEAVGVGKVTNIQSTNGQTEVYYSYSALSQEVSRDAIINCLSSSEQRRFKSIRFSRNWLFEISKSSFNCIGQT